MTDQQTNPAELVAELRAWLPQHDPLCPWEDAEPKPCACAAERIGTLLRRAADLIEEQELGAERAELRGLLRAIAAIVPDSPTAKAMHWRAEAVLKGEGDDTR